MNLKHIYRRLFSMLLMLAIVVSCVGTAFATETEKTITVTAEPERETKAATTTSSTIVGDWLNASTVGARGATNIMKDYAALGITDVYLLVKGTAGKLAWKSNVANTVTTSEVSAYGDILKQACDAAKPYGIRVHAWMMAGHDDHYMNNIDSSAMAYHFRVGYSSAVNQRLNLRDAGYREYTSKLVKEIVTNYDVAGIHLDCIRYFALYYDWGKNARDELLTNYGITIAQYNAATKAMCVTGGYSYSMNSGTTEGYNNGASYSYVGYSSSGTSASGSGFATVLSSSSYGDAYKGAQAFLKMRTDTVAGFVETVKEAAGDGVIISCALMPEPIEDTYNKCVYGQDPAKIGEVTDYIVPMAYASQYQKTASWPATLAEKCAAVGANVVIGEQAFDETYTSNASDLNAEIPQILAKAETVNAKANYGDILGYAFFRGALMTIGSATYNESDSTVDIYVGNQTSTSDTKHVFKLQNGMTVDTSRLSNGLGDKTGYNSGVSYTVSSDKKTITVSKSGSAILGGTKQASFTVAVNGTPSTTSGAVQLTSYYGSSYTEGKSFCITKGVDAGVYNGITKGTCGDTHSDIETWTDGSGKHFAFCYNCLTDLTETCVVETVDSDGYTAYECVGGLNPTNGKTDVDAHSATGGCGYSYVAATSLSMHFNPGDIADESTDWKKTAAGTITATVDTSKGILYGEITGNDPYMVTYLGSEAEHYNIAAGDIVEVRIKMSVASGYNKGFQVFFTTTEQTSFDEQYSVANHNYEHVSDQYVTIQLPFDSTRSYIGQSLTAIRIDPIAVPKGTECSATYEIDYIYLGPVSAAPSSQNSSELYFDFDNSVEALNRYSAVAYGNYNFDKSTEGYWATSANGGSKNYSIDNEAGTLTVNVVDTPDESGTYGPWLETTNTHGSYPWTGENHHKYYPLNFVPTNADYVQVRFKLNGCTAADDKTPMLALIYDYFDGGTYDADGRLRAEIDMHTEGYQTVTIELDEKFNSVDLIKSLGFRFLNILSAGDGTITIDYIYVGAKDQLYFGFDNTEADAQRYTSKTYGNNNFDNGNWAGRANCVENLTFEAGTVSFTSKDAAENYHYVQTSTNATTTDTPLRYVPSTGDMMQIRFKIENAVINGESSVMIHYMTDDGTQIKNDAVSKMALNESHLDGEYHLLNIPLDETFTAATIVTALRVGFAGVSSASDAAAKFTIDYIYVGQPENMPTQNKLFFDFTADKEAEQRYATDTYGMTDFDTTENWLMNDLGETAVEGGELKGTVTEQPYVRTALGGKVTADVLPLNYHPSAQDYLQLRFKLEGTSAVTANVKFYAYVAEKADWVNIMATDCKISSDYMLLTCDLSDTSFATAELVKGIQVAFDGVTDGTLAIDYIYVGSKADLPVTDYLYFDFTNTEKDKTRYDYKTYGNLNFDDPKTMQWKTLTTDLVDGITSIDNAEGVLTAAPAQENVTSICVDTTMNLIYDMSEAETMQLRLKIEGFAAVEGKTPFVTMQFFNNTGVAGSTDGISLSEEQLTDGDYLLFTIPLTEKIRSLGLINKLRLYFGNTAGGTNSKVTVDFIYIGAEEKIPMQDVLLFDFTNNEADRDRYSSKTYGNINYDLGNWSYNNTRNEAPVFDNTEGTVSTKVTASAPYLQTVGNSGSLASAPLTFAPNENTKIIQIKMKLENIVPVVEGTNGQIHVHLMTAPGEEVVSDSSLRYNIKPEDLNGEYFVVNFNAADFLGEIGTIYALRVTAGSLTAGEGAESRMVIDYIYVGDKDHTPAGKIFFVDFVGNDGETIVQHTTVSEAGTAAYTGALPEQEPDENSHYAFNGWTKKDGTKVDLNSHKFTEDTVLYPEFVASKHELAFVTNEDDSGYTVKMHACSGCEYMIVSDHVWDEGKVTTSTTCTAAGVKTFTCTLCGETKTEALGSSGHSLVKDAAVAATCTTDGLTEGSHCSVCNAVIVAQKVVAAIGHSYDDGVVTKESTCMEAGVLTYTCLICDETKTEDIELSGHDFIYHDKVDVTCLTDGNSAYYECSDCGKLYIDANGTYEIPIEFTVIKSTGHTTVYREAKAPTCIEEGYVKHYACTRCGKCYVDATASYEIPASYLVLPKTDHSYSYTNMDAYHVENCSVCGYSRVQLHTFNNGECLCGKQEVVGPILNEDLKFGMNISAGASMSVSYTFMATVVGNYKDFYLEVKKNVADGEPIVTTYGIADGREALEVVKHPATGMALIYNAYYDDIAAKEMSDSFESTLYAVAEDGKIYRSATTVSSVKDYLMSKIDAEGTIPEMNTMAVDMLKYGAAAQIRFEYNTQDLATSDLTEAQLAYGTQGTVDAEDTLLMSGSGANVSTYITVGSKVELNLSCICAGIEDPATVKCIIMDEDRNILAQPEVSAKANVMFTATYDNVGAREMREPIIATFLANGKIISKSVCWSVETYVAQTRADENATANEIALVNAMLAYGDSVAAYLEANGQ